MPDTVAHTFRKKERIVSKKLMERLFGGNESRSLGAFPLRVVYMVMERGAHDPVAQVLVSVPKRHFKRAVKRNRIKRQVRESYRLNKQLVTEVMDGRPGQALAMAFLWQSDQMLDTRSVEEKVRSLLKRITERL